MQLKPQIRQQLTLLLQRQHLEEQELRLRHWMELEKFHKGLGKTLELSFLTDDSIIEFFNRRRWRGFNAQYPECSALTAAVINKLSFLSICSKQIIFEANVRSLRSCNNLHRQPRNLQKPSADDIS